MIHSPHQTTTPYTHAQVRIKLKYRPRGRERREGIEGVDGLRGRLLLLLLLGREGVKEATAAAAAAAAAATASGGLRLAAAKRIKETAAAAASAAALGLGRAAAERIERLAAAAATAKQKILRRQQQSEARIGAEDDAERIQAQAWRQPWAPRQGPQMTAQRPRPWASWCPSCQCPSSSRP
jgi:hypothetical protein